MAVIDSSHTGVLSSMGSMKRAEYQCLYPHNSITSGVTFYYTTPLPTLLLLHSTEGTDIRCSTTLTVHVNTSCLKLGSTGARDDHFWSWKIWNGLLGIYLVIGSAMVIEKVSSVLGQYDLSKILVTILQLKIVFAFWSQL